GIIVGVTVAVVSRGIDWGTEQLNETEDEKRNQCIDRKKEEYQKTEEFFTDLNERKKDGLKGEKALQDLLSDKAEDYHDQCVNERKEELDRERALRENSGGSLSGDWSRDHGLEGGDKKGPDDKGDGGGDTDRDCDHGSDGTGTCKE
ncbi:MAG: hypothetical protein KDD62_09825, partial [Bdellovibrionales bacterium]|nr:hypothetical protein [Bdellovibrionales bacterium]